jgi:hypothetical protein
MTQPTEYENVTHNSPEGAIFGRTSTDRVGFWGVLPVARPVTASTNDVSTTTFTSTSSAAVAVTTWGYASRAEIDNVIAAVSTMQLTMKALGLVASGVDTTITRTNETFEMLDYGSPDGAQMGNASTEAIGFYGATPVIRSSLITNNISTTTTVSASTVGATGTPWGWMTSTEIGTFNTAVSTMQRALKQLGLMV